MIPFALSLSKRGIWQDVRSCFDGLTTNGVEAERDSKGVEVHSRRM